MGCHQRHKAIYFHPDQLIKSCFNSFSVAIQKPGDLILTDGHGCHQGYNAGNNLAIAVNWATMNWVTHSYHQHLDSQTHDIVYGCQCFGIVVGIPFDVWSSNHSIPHQFGHLYKLGAKERLPSSQVTAELPSSLELSIFTTITTRLNGFRERNCNDCGRGSKCTSFCSLYFKFGNG